MTAYCINTGDFVISLAGRDRGHIMVVMEVTDELYITAADGKLRSVKKPKKKKIRHIKKLNVPPYSGELTNRFVARAIREAKSLCHEIRRDYSA